MLGPAISGSLAASSEEQQRILNKNNNNNEKTFEGSFGSPQCFRLSQIPFLLLFPHMPLAGRSCAVVASPCPPGKRSLKGLAEVQAVLQEYEDG